MNDPTCEISDEDLTSLLSKSDKITPYSGVFVMYGSLRARGLKVARE